MNQINPGSENSELLRKRSLTDEVYEYLSDRIIAGNYSSGDWLRQEDISTLLGVGQTPVRLWTVVARTAERVPIVVRVRSWSRKNRECISPPPDLETTGARFAAKVILQEVNSCPVWLKRPPI
jgi:hypothetical protein